MTNAGLEIISTDRYRALRSVAPGVCEESQQGDAGLREYLVDGKDLATIVKLITTPVKTQGQVYVTWDSATGENLAVVVDGVEVACKQGEGDHPKVDHLIDGWEGAIDQFDSTDIRFNPTHIIDLANMLPSKRNDLKLEFGPSNRRPVRTQWVHGDVRNTHILMPTRPRN